MNGNNNSGNNTNNNSNFAGNIGNGQLNLDNTYSLNNVEQTFDDAQRNRLNSGLILADESKRKGILSPQPDNSERGSGSSNLSNNVPSSSKLSSNANSANASDSSSSSKLNSTRINPQQGALRRDFLKNAAQHYFGLSPRMANAIFNSDNTKNRISSLNNGNNNRNVLDKLADRDKFLDDDQLNKEDDIDSSSKSDKKSDLEEKSKILRGEINAQISKKVLKVILIVTPFVAVLLFFTIAILAYIDDNKISSMEISKATSEKTDQELKDLALEYESGKSSGNVGKGSDDIPQEYLDRLSSLGNLYTSQLNCKGEDCYDRAEFKYYLKISDIAYRYREKYSVKLDWLLISATNLYFEKDTEKIMEDNLGGYNESSVKNTDSLISLDWDYDYKNISNYEYLDADDSTYDLQILAKNMVKKKTTQSCYGSGGSVKTQEDEDVEDKYFEVGGSKRLKCDTGEKYSIISSYDIDMEKFDEFMLEYIDKKMYTKGSGKNKENSSNSCVSTNDSYIWPVGSDKTTNVNGKEYALGEPAITNITSYFGSNESFRTSGHGAIDIAGGTGVGVTNVIAAKSGTVVYPPDESWTKFPDNGYYGNPDGGGYGNYIIIKHDDGNYSLYAHLSQNSIRVVAGDVVDQGQVIAKLGHSGSSTGPHLHFEMRGGENSNTHRIDPLKYVDPKDPRKNITTSTNCSQKKNEDLADVFVDLALKQKDDPKARNGIKYKEGATSYYPWCAAFVNWIINNTESNGKKLSDIIKSSENKAPYTAYSWANHFESQKDLKFKYNDNCSTLSGKNNSSNTYVPKKGDLIFFSDDRSFTSLPATFNNINHIGIVQGTDGDKIITIEGNSNNVVAERTYPLNSCQVIGFGSWY